MPSPDDQRVRRLIWTFGFTAFAGALATRITDPLVADIARDFQVTAADAALLSSAFALPYALIQPVLGPVGDALGKRRIINAGLFVLAAMLAAGALAPGFTTLMIFRVLAGAAAGAVMPVTLAVIGDAVPMAQRQVALSRLLVFAITGQILGGAVAGPAAAIAGWRGALALCAAVALLAAVLLALSARRGLPEAAGRFDLAVALRRYRGILSNPAALTLYATVSVEGAIVFGVFPFIAPLLIARGIGGTAEAGLTVGAFGLGGLVYAALARRLLARMGQGLMVMLGGALGAAAFLALAGAESFALAAAAGLLLGTGFYMIHNSIQTRVTEVAPQARGSAVALHAFSFFAGQSLGPVLFGLGSATLGAAATLACCACGILVLSLVLGRRP
ncbi:MAG TPA: MFS transporter [Acetobacteraceae bacterium]|nr:MFS transporter [Acetobacteraceae bacterium]